jgi:hypothetical protein
MEGRIWSESPHCLFEDTVSYMYVLVKRRQKIQALQETKDPNDHFHNASALKHAFSNGKSCYQGSVKKWQGTVCKLLGWAAEFAAGLVRLLESQLLPTIIPAGFCLFRPFSLWCFTLSGIDPWPCLAVLDTPGPLHSTFQEGLDCCPGTKQLSRTKVPSGHLLVMFATSTPNQAYAPRCMTEDRWSSRGLKWSLPLKSCPNRHCFSVD